MTISEEQGTCPAPALPEQRFSMDAIHLTRTAHTNGVAQARMAVQKASILLGAKFLVFSLSISRAMSGIVPLSLAVLPGFAFASSLCAVVAVLPSIVQPGVKAVRRNLLFFGQFAEI